MAGGRTDAEGVGGRYRVDAAGVFPRLRRSCRSRLPARPRRSRMAKLTTLPDEETLARAAAERLTGVIAHAIRRRGHAMVALTGGRTPRRLYELLGDRTEPWRGHIDWARVHLFWGDERHVPPDHPDSNF